MDFTVAVPLVSRYLQGDASAAQRATIISDLVQLLNSGDANILSVVGALQDCLTSDNSTRRAQGAQLLAQVLSHAGPVLSTNDLHHLSIFMAARLSDWPCTEPAAEGCTTLLEMLHQQSAKDATAQNMIDDALVIVRAATSDLSGHVQQLPQKDRAAALQLLLVSTQLWGSHSALAGINLVDALIGAIDGEKDPRCLLLAFNCVQAVAQVYHGSGIDPTPWVSQCEEVVEVLSCYFPLTFNPPKTDPHKITRQQLASSLMSSLTASPFMTSWVLPLVMEKLSSTYRPAQVDALAALTAAFTNYGPEAMQPHVSEVWSGLRGVLLAPGQLPSSSSASDDADVWQLADQAAACLTAGCRSMQGGTLQQCVMTDQQVLPHLLSLVRGGAAAAHPDAPQLGLAGDASNIVSGSYKQQDYQLIARARIIGAVAAAGPVPAGQILSAAIPALLDTVSHTPASQQPTGHLVHDTTATNSSSSVIPPGSTRQWYVLAAAQHMLLPLVHSGSQQGGTLTVTEEMMSVLQPWVIRLWDVAHHIVLQLSSALKDPRLGNSADIEMVDAAGGKVLPLPDNDTALHVMITACSLINTLLALGHTHTGAVLSYQQLSPVAETMCDLSLIADPSLPLTQGVASQRMVVQINNGTKRNNDVQKPTEAALGVARQMLAAYCNVEEVNSDESIPAVLTQHIMQQLTNLYTSRVQQDDRDTGSTGAAGLLQASWLQAIHVCATLSDSSPAMSRHAVQQLAHLGMRLMSDMRSGCVPSADEVQHVSTSCLKDVLQLAVSCIAGSGVGSSRQSAGCGSTIAAAAALAQACMQHEAATTAATTTTGVSSEVAGEGVARLSVIATCAGYMTSCCDANEQGVLAQHAEQLLVGAASSTQQVAVPVTACVVLAAVRQGVVLDTRLPDLVSQLMLLGSATTSLSHTQGAMQAQALAVCLAALINKATDASLFKQQASSILQQLGLNLSTDSHNQQQQQQQQANSPHLTDWVMQALSWVICALAVRASALATPAVQSLITLMAGLPQQLISTGSHEAPISLTDLAIQARNSTGVDTGRANVRLVILCHNLFCKLFAASTRPAVNTSTTRHHHQSHTLTWHHIVTRPLWQQKALNGCLPFLISQLQQHRSHEALHACLASLLAAAPQPLIKQHFEHLLPHLSDTAATILKVLLQVSAQQKGVLSDVLLRAQCSQLLHEQLAGLISRFLTTMLDDASCCALFANEVGGLLPSITAMCTLKGYPALREQALSLIMLCAQQLPYHVLHPSSHAVLKAVTAALDDDKRSVRQLAAKARRVWSQK